MSDCRDSEFRRVSGIYGSESGGDLAVLGAARGRTATGGSSPISCCRGLDSCSAPLIWLGLGAPAKIAGGIWFVIGVVVLATHTRWFRKELALPDPAHYE